MCDVGEGGERPVGDNSKDLLQNLSCIRISIKREEIVSLAYCDHVRLQSESKAVTGKNKRCRLEGRRDKHRGSSREETRPQNCNACVCVCVLQI